MKNPGIVQLHPQFFCDLLRFPKDMEINGVRMSDTWPPSIELFVKSATLPTHADGAELTRYISVYAGDGHHAEFAGWHQ